MEILGRSALLAILLLGSFLPTCAATLIYRTTFESFEGYNANFTLSGQNNWSHFGTGGNGLVTDFIPGAGQSAYIGFSAPTNSGEFLNVWRPVNLVPVPTNLSVVTFSVTMRVIDSSNGRRDDFRWSLYNTNGARLFSLDFDNVTTGINYGLDNGAGFVATVFGVNQRDRLGCQSIRRILHPRFEAPKQAEALAVPAQESLRLDDL